MGHKKIPDTGDALGRTTRVTLTPLRKRGYTRKVVDCGTVNNVNRFVQSPRDRHTVLCSSQPESKTGPPFYKSSMLTPTYDQDPYSLSSLVLEDLPSDADKIET